jgi:hypothetical protein
MGELFSSSLFTFCFFTVVGSVIVFLILKFDNIQRKKLSKIIADTADVQPLYMQKSTGSKLHALKKICKDDTLGERVEVAKKLELIVADYNKGNISLPDYNNRLNNLLALVA